MLPASRAAAPTIYSELLIKAMSPLTIEDLKSIRVQTRNRNVPIMKKMAAVEES